MANTILHKRSSTALAVPATTDLSLGELAVNTYDGKLYLKKNDGVESIVPIGGIENVVEDLTPQLGGDLDTNSFNIVTTDTIGTVVDNIAIVAGASAYALAGTGVAGGSIALSAGASANAEGNGGSILLVAGAATVDGTGGAITLTSGAGTGATGAAGGAITLTAGDSDTSLPGNIVISAGATTAVGGTSGAVSILTPNSTSGYVGDIVISSGNTTYASGSGSDITLFAGDSGGQGGNIVLQPGNGSTTGGALPSRAITIQDAAYGAVGFMRAGNNAFDIFTHSIEGNTAAINITSGDALATGAAGNINITAGSGTPSFATGGSVIITTGANGGFGAPTSVKLPSPDPTGFVGGTLEIFDPSNTNSTSIRASSALAGLTSFILPPDDGTNGFILSTDGTGVTSWTTPPVINNWLIANADTDFATAPTAAGANAFAIGQGAAANGSYSVVLGNTAVAAGSRGIAIGMNSSAAAIYGTAIGTSAKTDQSDGIVIGRTSQAYGGSAPIAIGFACNTAAEHTVALGFQCNANGISSVALGDANTAQLTRQIILGTDITSTSVAVDVPYSVKLGYGVTVDKNIMHLHSKGKLEVEGDEAMLVAPTYADVGTTPPLNGLAGGLVYDTLSSSLQLFNGTSWVGVGGLANVVEDLTPQLGGALDVNGQIITSVAAGNIVITPDTTGSVVIDGLSWPQVDGNSGELLQTDGAGILSFADLKHIAINSQTGTAYTLVLADDNKLIAMNNAAANILTIPDNATVAFPIGTQILVEQEGAGQTTIAGAAGVTLTSAGSLVSLSSQYSTLTLIKKAVDTWLLAGDLA